MDFNNFTNTEYKDDFYMPKENNNIDIQTLFSQNVLYLRLSGRPW